MNYQDSTLFLLQVYLNIYICVCVCVYALYRLQTELSTPDVTFALDLSMDEEPPSIISVPTDESVSVAQVRIIHIQYTHYMHLRYKVYIIVLSAIR